MSGGDRVYETARIARNSRYRIGRDSLGNPAILIETSRMAGAEALSDFEGRHLLIGHGVNCSISEHGVEVRRARFSVVTCRDADDLLKQRFFDATETLLRSLGETPTVQELSQVVGGLIELFRLASQPPRGTIQGLWAELWIVAQARDPEVLLQAWHTEPSDAYDFNSGLERIEVKSTSQSGRKHAFSHGQLKPPAGTKVAIASVFVKSSGGGQTISELTERIRRRVASIRTLRRLDFVIARTLGIDWRTGVEAAFDSEVATESLRFFAVDDVPSLSADIPSGVSDIRYVSDLSGAEALYVDEMLEDGGLFAAATPADGDGRVRG